MLRHEFPPTARVVDAVAARLAACGVFAEVRPVAVSGWETMLRVLPDLAAYPAAVAMAGGTTYADGGLTRTLDAHVRLGDEFRATAEDGARGYDLGDIALAAFSPEDGFALPELGPGLGFCEVRGLQPVDLEGQHNWWLLSLIIHQGPIAGPAQ